MPLQVLLFLLVFMVIAPVPSVVAEVGWPDPAFCTVMPMDMMSCPRVVGSYTESPMGLSQISLTLEDSDQFPCPGVLARVDNNVDCCDYLCCCEGWDETVYCVTDANGNGDIWFRKGGFCDQNPEPPENPESADAWIVVDPVDYRTPYRIRIYDVIVGHSYWGYGCNECRANLPDFIWFGAYSYDYGPKCTTDYTGDCYVNLSDFLDFASDYAESACDNYNPPSPQGHYCSD